MRSIGAMMCGALLLSGCSGIGILGVELEFTSEDVSVAPMASNLEQGHFPCRSERLGNFACQ